MSRLIFFDTSNYRDFPIGGQLTAVGNFLCYLSEKHPEVCGDVVLVGVETEERAVGVMGRSGPPDALCTFPFLPVACAGTDLAHTKKSLRLAYAEGIVKYGRKLKITKEDLCYIQTPEAAGAIRLLYPRARYAVFSHGSYANMERGFRFFQKNRLVKKAFLHYLHSVIRNAELIFILDEDSRRAYEKENKNLILVSNSVRVPQKTEPHPFEGRLLFVGRLSKDKGVGGILKAAALLNGEGFPVSLTIVGDGEASDALRAMPEAEHADFAGAVPPDRVRKYLESSDILVMNSAFEGVPMTILEALSFGLPVISTDVGGISGAVSFGKDSEKTDGTPEGIAAAVRKIAGRYDSYARAARQHGLSYDYRSVGDTIFGPLCGLWRQE